MASRAAVSALPGRAQPGLQPGLVRDIERDQVPSQCDARTGPHGTAMLRSSDCCLDIGLPLPTMADRAGPVRQMRNQNVAIDEHDRHQIRFSNSAIRSTAVRKSGSLPDRNNSGSSACAAFTRARRADLICSRSALDLRGLALTWSVTRTPSTTCDSQSLPLSGAAGHVMDGSSMPAGKSVGFTSGSSGSGKMRLPIDNCSFVSVERKTTPSPVMHARAQERRLELRETMQPVRPVITQRRSPYHKLSTKMPLMPNVE